MLMPYGLAVKRVSILAILRRLSVRDPREHILSSTAETPSTAAATEEPEVRTAAETDATGRGDDAGTNGNGDGSHDEGRWALDLIGGFVPLNDRGGPISLSGDADGPLLTLAQIELNIREGRDAGFGLRPDPLNDPESP
jgi:hypothetical protein